MKKNWTEGAYTLRFTTAFWRQRTYEKLSPSSWPYVCVAVRPEIFPYGKMEHIKFRFIITKHLKVGTFSWGACLKFTSHIKCDFISSPHALKTYKTENMNSNAYFSMLGLDFVVFQRNTPDVNWNNCVKLWKIIFPN